MNKGTKSYTEFEYTPDVIAFMSDNPEAFELKHGLVHSHNTFGVFFSSTDNDELKSNCKNHTYYLSLIVNNKYETCAKVGVYTETDFEAKGTTKRMNSDGSFSYVPYTKKGVYSDCIDYDCLIIKPIEQAEQWFVNRVAEICKPKKSVQTSLQWTVPKGTKSSVTLYQFIGAFIAGDAEYSGSVNGALKLLNNNQQSDDELVAILEESFEFLYDEMGVEADREFEAISLLYKYNNDGKHTFPKAYRVINQVIELLTSGIDGSI